MTEVKFNIKATDMEDNLINQVKEYTTSALKDLKSEKDVAKHLREQMQKAEQPGWNCIVGRGFGSFIKHKTKKYIFFQVNDQLMILLWQA